MTTEALALAGQRVVTYAMREWNRDIFDPPIGSAHPRAAECCAVIDEIIKFNGWGFALPHGRYIGNAPPQWCGMFAGRRWAEAGLDPKPLIWGWASTLRLGCWFSYRPWNNYKNPRPTNGDLRLWGKLEPGKPLPFTPQSGDVVIVGTGKVEWGKDKGKPQPEGAHVTISAGFDEATRSFDTISGNGGGVGPHGDHREGISRATFSIDTGVRKAMWIGRPAFGDLLAERPA